MYSKFRKTTLIFLIFNLIGLNQLFANTEDDLEALYEKSTKAQVKKIRKKRNLKSKAFKKSKYSLDSLSTLEHVADVAVVQRRYLPTAGRFEISPMLTLGMNNAFFNNIGLGVKATYFFTTRHGIEVQYLLMNPSKKAVTKNLEDISVKTLATSANSYMGATYKWTPFSGKSAFFNKIISHYDTYFVLGGGITATGLEDATTIQFGVGQNYTIDKSLAVKLDVTVNTYSATGLSPFGGRVTSQQSDIFLSLGAAFYFPEATYR